MKTETMNPKRTARIAGVLYLLLAPFGMLALLYTISAIIVPGDTAATVNNLIANESMFRLSMLSALVTQVLNVMVVIYLYRLLKPVNHFFAQLMALFIFLGAPLAMAVEISRGAALLLLENPVQNQELINMFLHLHEYGIQIASVFWGLWLLPMGILVYKSNYIPKLIGVLLVIGCFGYLIDVLTFFLLPQSNFTVAQFTFLGEIILPLWLVIKSVDVEQFKARVVGTAVA